MVFLSQPGAGRWRRIVLSWRGRLQQTPPAQVLPPLPASRLIGLDVLRVAAVLLVLGRHVPEAADGSVEPGIFLHLWQRIGWIGVDLFFVLSGFLVSGLLFRDYRERGAIRLKRFLLRRGFKIYPAFYAFLLLSLLLLRRDSKPITPLQVTSELLFLQSYLPRLWPHTWTLAVEEHFYLGIGCLLAVLGWRCPQNAFRCVLPLALLVALGALSLRVANSVAVPFNFRSHLYPTHLRIDSLMCGALLAYLYQFHGEGLAAWMRRWRSGAFFAATACIAPCIVCPIESSVFMYTGGLTLLYIGFGLLLLTVVDLQPRAGSIAAHTLQAISRLGIYSYSIYLWHMPMRSWAPRLASRISGAPLDLETSVLVYVLSSLVVGIIMAHLIEIPMLRIRDRLAPP